MYLATVPGLLHEESSRVRDWGDSTRHRPLVCEAIDMAARRCPHTTGGDGIPLDSTRTGAASTPPPSSPTTWRATAFALRWAGPGCAGRVPGRKPAGAALKEREGLSDGPPPQEARPPGILPPRSTPVHTIRNSSTPPWGTGRRARSTRTTEQHDKQPETPPSRLPKTHPAAHRPPDAGAQTLPASAPTPRTARKHAMSPVDALHCPDRWPRPATRLISYNGSRAVPTETAILMIYLSGHVVQALVPAKRLSCP